MTNELAPIRTLALAGIEADAAANRHAFGEYTASVAANSLRAHRQDLSAFSAYLAAVGVNPAPTANALQTEPQAWTGVTNGLVKGFREYQMQQGFAVATVNRRLATVKVYAKLAGIETPTANAIGHKAGRNRDEKRAEEGMPTRRGIKKAANTKLTPKQAKMLKQNHADTPQGRRDALLMCLLLDHGLRCGEVALLKTTDFDANAGTLRFYRPKVDKVQTHRLTEDTRRALIAYLPHAPEQGAILRSSRKNGKLDQQGMSERAITGRVQALGEALGIESLSAHDCRHYWATRATVAGTHPKALQQAGGWNSPAMVFRYVQEAEIANDGVIL